MPWNFFVTAYTPGKVELFKCCTQLLNIDLLISAQMQPSAGRKNKLGETAITCCCITATEVSLAFMFLYTTETTASC